MAIEGGCLCDECAALYYPPEPRHPWTSCQIPYRHIAQRLIDLGAPVEQENRP